METKRTTEETQKTTQETQKTTEKVKKERDLMWSFASSLFSLRFPCVSFVVSLCLCSAVAELGILRRRKPIGVALMIQFVLFGTRIATGAQLPIRR
jgi:hypothetical protein